jgi:hypothetical protein
MNISKGDILSILHWSRQYNEKNKITGILLYWKKTNQFMQVLEGEENIILNLFDKICKDTRHSSLKIIYQDDIIARGFKGWTMAFQDIDEIDTSGLDGFSEFLKLDFTTERTNISNTIAINLIRSFRSFLP